MMSLIEVAEWFEIMLAILAFSMFWHFVLRPVLLDIIKASLFRLRDQLRLWYISLPIEQKTKQEFSYLFMERAINCVTLSVEEVSIWRSMHLRNASALESEERRTLKTQISRFMLEKDADIDSIDSKHSLLFALLLLINSPFAFIATVIYGVFQVIEKAAKSQNFESPVSERLDSFRGASHQQVSCI